MKTVPRIMFPADPLVALGTAGTAADTGAGAGAAVVAAAVDTAATVVAVVASAALDAVDVVVVLNLSMGPYGTYESCEQNLSGLVLCYSFIQNHILKMMAAILSFYL